MMSLILLKLVVITSSVLMVSSENQGQGQGQGPVKKNAQSTITVNSTQNDETTSPTISPTSLEQQIEITSIGALPSDGTISFAISPTNMEYQIDTTILQSSPTPPYNSESLIGSELTLYVSTAPPVEITSSQTSAVSQYETPLSASTVESQTGSASSVQTQETHSFSESSQPHSTSQVSTGAANSTTPNSPSATDGGTGGLDAPIWLAVGIGLVLFSAGTAFLLYKIFANGKCISTAAAGRKVQSDKDEEKKKIEDTKRPEPEEVIHGGVARVISVTPMAKYKSVSVKIKPSDYQRIMDRKKLFKNKVGPQ